MSFKMSADPAITANIYASGLLDHLIRDAIAPFGREVAELYPDGYKLWIMRYARGGEHLKIRIHGKKDYEQHIQQLLGRWVENWFEQVASKAPADSRNDNPKAPAIDIEDESSTKFADRSVVWTHYRRTYISFPASPWLEDDEFIGLAAQALSASTEVYLEAVTQEEMQLNSKKQTVLAKALISGLLAAGMLEPSITVEYLTFHRDWLLRFFIKETSKELETRSRFQQQAQGSQRAIASLIEFREREAHSMNESTRPWPVAVSKVAKYVQQFQSDQHYQIDPFTKNVAFPPLFKIFHGMANQFGIMPLHEAYVHHLLIKVIEEYGDRFFKKYAAQVA